MMKYLAILTALLVALGGLAACTSTNRSEILSSATGSSASEPMELMGNESSTASALQPAEIVSPSGAALVDPPASSTIAAVEAPAGGARLRLFPVVGAPAGAVRAMSQQIANRSGQHGIAILPPASEGATHDLKGYFSAITEGDKTTVIFVWDIFDPSGNRLHRIQGQETASGSSPDGWSSVTAQTMEQIGVRTIDEIAQWLAGGNRG